MAKRKRKNLSAPPGSIIFTGNRQMPEVLVHYMEYNESKVDEKEVSNVAVTTFQEPVDDLVQWYDIRGLHDVDLIAEIGKVFNVHNLVLEDIVDVNQRPKFEEYDDEFFISCKAVHFDPTERKINVEQVTLYVGDGFVLSFQEDANDLFLDIRKRIHNGRGRIRRKDSSYLAYAILDSLLNNYYLALDQIEDVIDLLEVEISEGSQKKIKSEIHKLKRELLVFKKIIAPTREAIARFSKSDHKLIPDSTQLYIRDLHDTTIQIMDNVDTYRDTTNGLQDLYISEISLRMNQVMQVLTIVTTIFVPLSFLAGLYGMNFKHIPELEWQNGYFILLGVMGLICLGMLLYFKHKKWF